MKKNRRKKKIKNTSPANNKSGIVVLRVRFNDLLRSKAAGFQTLRDAVVIWGTVEKGNSAIFYGDEVVEELIAGIYTEPGIKTVAMVSLDGDKFEEQAETLRKIVEELKGAGTCCYGRYAEDESDADSLDNAPCFVFVDHGNRLIRVTDDGSGVVIALSRKTAEKLKGLAKRDLEDMKMSIADVHAVFNSTLNKELDKNFGEGYDCAYLIEKIDSGGILWHVVRPSKRSSSE